VFDTVVLEGDEHGITKLKFTFDQPLDAAGYHFYVSSPVRPAYRLRFDRDAEGAMSAGHAALFARARDADPDVRKEARESIAALARPLAVQSGHSIQSDLGESLLASDEALERVEAWWREIRGSARLGQYAEWYRRSSAMLRERGIYFRIDGLAREVVRSDLFLTGGREE
jgi:hypothetical protein